ncbi:MAG: YjgP/YjgQ family permease [bacterium]|nr:YjgP/YjgQ family permease [bacterium]
MFRLDRYIIAETLGPMGLGFLVYTFLLLLRFLFRSAEMIIMRGVPVALVGKLLLLSLPNIIVVTIPMALLLGILIAVGRLSTDSELVALRSCGISLFSLFRPIVVLSALLTGLNLYLILQVLPEGNNALQQLRVEIVTQSPSEHVEARVPYSGWRGKTLYVFATPPGERGWQGILFADSIPGNENDVVIAERGEAQTDEADGRVVLSLENAYQHRVDFSDPDDYNIISHTTFVREVALGDRPRATRSVRRGMRELKFRELLQVTADPTRSADERNLARIEIHKKFSIPAACLVFGLLGLSLGVTSARGGRFSGFALSLVIILIYYILLNAGEKFAGKGVVSPWLAVWFSNLLLLAVGLYLLAQRNRDQSLLLTYERLWGRFLSYQRNRQARKIARRRNATARRGWWAAVRELSDVWPRFPNAMDRYILRTFLRVLVLASFSGIIVYLVADLTGYVDDILNNQVPFPVLFNYYLFKSAAILYEIAPILVLMSTLIGFGLLSRTNEVTACRSLGMSLYRLAAPVVVAALAVAMLFGLLQWEVLPASNRRVAELETIIEGRESTLGYRRADRRWLAGEGGLLYNYLHYDQDRQELHRLQVLEFDAGYRLTRRLLVDRARYIDEGWWRFTGGWTRTFDGNKVTSFRKFAEPERHRLAEAPDFFAAEYRQPDEMDYHELDAYIERLRESGQQVPELEVQLHRRIAYPAISLVMALVALPFSFRLGRSGTLYGVGLSMVVGLVFMALLALFSALGKTAILPPMLAVWSPSLIFTIFSLYLFLGVRT